MGYSKSAPTNVEPDGLIRARWINDKNNNVYKTKGSKHYVCCFLQYQDEYKSYKLERVLLSRKTVYSGISKFILQFPNFFHILCTIFSIVNFNTVLSMFPFLFHWLHIKVGAVHSSDWSLFRKRSIIDLLNIQAATAENEEQYTLSNIVYIAFQNSHSFLWNFLW